MGLTYFGERYLVQRIGRWATPDPLAVHAMGGGEGLNSYHYVSGNLLQARDPLGLEPALKLPPQLPPVARPVLRVIPGGGGGTAAAEAAGSRLLPMLGRAGLVGLAAGVGLYAGYAISQNFQICRDGWEDIGRAIGSGDGSKRASPTVGRPAVPGQPPGNADAHWRERSATAELDELNRRANGGPVGAGASSSGSAATVVLTGVADYGKEARGARVFGSRLGGGQFDFLGNSSQGIEGYFDGGQGRVGVSMKDFSDTGKLKNIIGRINKNANKIREAVASGQIESVPVEGWFSVRQYSVDEVSAFVQGGQIAKMPNEGVFNKITFEASDGFVEVTRGGVTSRPSQESR